MLDKMYEVFYVEGWNARIASEAPSYEKCPYSDDTFQSETWLEGWQDADSEFTTKYADIENGEPEE